VVRRRERKRNRTAAAARQKRNRRCGLIRNYHLSFSSIGDIVLTTPVIRCLKQQVPGAEVHFLTKWSFHSIIEANPWIDKRHYLDEDFDVMLHQLQTEHFDYIIDLHHNLRTLRVKKALPKAKSFSFKKLNIEKWLLTNLKINTLPDVHIVDRCLKTVASFGVQNDGMGLDYFIPEAEKVKERDIPTSHLAGYIGLVTGAALNTKKLPLHQLQNICRQIDHPIMLLGGKEDYEQGKAIASVDPVKIYNACGKFSLNESADLVQRAKLIISHDTGLMHIAAAMKKNIISIWGNTVPAFGMYPYYGEKYITGYQQRFGANALPYDIVEVKGLGCRPCSKIGYDACPKKHFKCMENIDTALVAKLAAERLAKK
jgi:ADP-heptose:LPS heptosyltransferase